MLLRRTRLLGERSRLLKGSFLMRHVYNIQCAEHCFFLSCGRSGVCLQFEHDRSTVTLVGDIDDDRQIVSKQGCNPRLANVFFFQFCETTGIDSDRSQDIF